MMSIWQDRMVGKHGSNPHRDMEFCLRARIYTELPVRRPGTPHKKAPAPKDRRSTQRIHPRLRLRHFLAFRVRDQPAPCKRPWQ